MAKSILVRSAALIAALSVRRLAAGLVSVASLLTSVVLLCGTIHAQVCNPDPLRWGNVSAWKGTFSETGNGSGTLSASAGPCPLTNYKNTQTINGAPVLQGSYPNWAGPSFSIADVNVATNLSCVTPIGLVTGQNSEIGSGPPAGGDLFQLSIDCGRYSLRPQNVINDTITSTLCAPIIGCTTHSASSTFSWGPVFGPGGDVVVGLPANNTSGTGVIPLPAVGVDLSYTVPTYTDNFDNAPAATWNANWKFSPKCQVKVPNNFWQNNPLWGGDPYGGKPSKTLGALGCALTSLTMAMQYAYAISNPNSPFPPEFSNPGNLNIAMTTDADFNLSAVSWDRAARRNSGNKLKFDPLGGFKNSVDDPVGAKQVLDYALCHSNPHPVIVGVKLAICGPTGCPGHFVLVTGRDEDGNYTIIDPATGGAGSLNTPPYLGEFSTRGIVRDPPGDISALDIDTGDNVTLLVTDALGNRTGTDPTSGSPLQQIPGSAYFIDRVDDDITGEVDTHPAHMVLIPTPKQGTFTIVAQGVNSGPYTISISAFSQDGSPQPRIVFTGNAVPGSTTTYTINYASTPGATSVVNFSAVTAKAEIETGSYPGFEVRGSFTLGAGSSGITPDTQPVTLKLGSYTATIPAGSFKRYLTGNYAFEGTINGVHLEFRIAPVGGNSFTFKAEAQGVNLTGAANPVSLNLQIGSDGGTTQVTAEFS